jgi:hypothetical protein
MRKLKYIAVDDLEFKLLKKVIIDKLKGTRSEASRILLRNLKNRICN